MRTKLAFLIAMLTGAIAAPMLLAAEAGKVLKSYEAVSSALANDDLAAAKTAASNLASEARSAGETNMAQRADELAKSRSLKDAREHFKAVSTNAVKLAEGTDDYHVMQCPMADAKWVQSGEKMMNPYMGKMMQQCGEMMREGKGMMHGDDQADATSMAGCCPMKT